MSAEEVNELYNTIVKEKAELEHFIDFDFHPEYDYNQLNDEITEKIEDLSIRAEIPIEEINERLKVDVEELFKKRILTTDEVRFELVNTSNLKQKQTMNEQQNTSVKEVKDYKKQWEDFQFDTTQPLTTKDVYAFFGKGGTAEFISRELSKMSNKEVIIPSKYIKNIDLWNFVVKPFRELPQETQTALKESLMSFVNQSKDVKINTTNEQKSQQMYNFYKNQYEIKPSTKLTKHDIYAFLFQYGAKAKEKLLERTKDVLGSEVNFYGVKSEDFENFIINPILAKGADISTNFKQQLVDLLPNQKILQEQNISQPQPQQAKQNEESYAERHLKHMDLNKGLSDKNIFALTILGGGEQTLQAKESVLKKFLGLSLEETKKLDRDQMIEKVKEVKFGERTPDLGEYQFKEAIQRVFLISEAEKNSRDTYEYAKELSSLEYPDNELWESKHIDKMLTEIDIEFPLSSNPYTEDLAIQYKDLLNYIDENREELVHLNCFYDSNFIDFKQKLLNEINKNPYFEQVVLNKIENTKQNSIKIGR